MNLLRFVTGDSANIHATFIQAAGLWMFGLLLAVLSRTVSREWFTSFAKSFILLAVSISSLRVAFGLGAAYGRAFFAGYFLAEYFFLYYLVRGAMELAGVPPHPRPLKLLAAGLLMAALLALSPDFSAAFVVQAGVMAAGLFLAFFYALRTRAEGGTRIGLHILRLSLFVLGVGFAQYVPIVGTAVWIGEDLPRIYNAFLPVFDLLFESMLACAMIIAGMESVHLELVESNRSLEAAKGKLDVLARTDPLTELMNRHAFAAVLEAPPANAQGSVAVIDLDGLKAINDTHGHHAGDIAIRAFARALRGKLRADDLIFRWGGDEFLAILLGLPPKETQARLETLGDVEFQLGPEGAIGRVKASFGIAPFSSIGELRAAADQADALMYASKKSRRQVPAARS